MPLYKILNGEKGLQPFRASHLGSKYLERDLEDWIERSPEVLVGDEPLLIIGRQVDTPVGVIDLLALDSNGAGIVIELKRVPSQREAVGQSLEYVSWLSTASATDLRIIAERYLGRNGCSYSLEEAWQETFSSDFKESTINAHQRVFIIVEGENDRMASLVRFLRSSGVDVSLLTYSFYRTSTGEEILHLEAQVGESEPALQQDAKPSEVRLIDEWTQDVVEAYQEFKGELLSRGLYARAKKTGMSFFIQTQEGSTFLCYFNSTNDDIKVWLRSDSMSTLIDFNEVVSRIRDRAPAGVQVKHTPTWFILRFTASVEDAASVASLLLSEVVDRLLGQVDG